MPVYICRWQSGDLSVAYASKREDADMLFDEIGNPDLALVFRGPARFAVHFKLKRRPDPSDALPLDLDCFNEEAYCDLGAKVYPVLYELDDDADPAAVKAAAHEERTRQMGKKKARLSTDSEERHLQEVGHDIPRALARSVVREMRQERGKKGDSLKKN
jgi:hypothetical protein